MAALGCDWRTVQDWADLAGQDPSLYLGFMGQGGSTYFRVCDDGTVWMQRDLFDAIADA
jgi:hypothetical protein